DVVEASDHAFAPVARRSYLFVSHPPSQRQSSPGRGSSVNQITGRASPISLVLGHSARRTFRMGRISFAASIAALLIASVVESSHAQSVTVPPGGRVIAPEFQQMAIKRAEERKKLDACHREAEEQKILTRDKTKFLVACVER